MKAEKSAIWPKSGPNLNEECILGLRGRQFEGGKCDVIVAVGGCAIFLMVLTFAK